MLSLVTRLYAFLLRLYPRSFRDEFAEEMRTVFADYIAEATRRGNIALIRLLLTHLTR